MRVGIIAALPGELKPLVKGWKRAPAREGSKKWSSSPGNDVWIAVCAGMGPDAVQRAFAEAESDGALDLVLSVGWAGALREDLIPTCVYIASAVINAQTGERTELSKNERDLALVSTVAVADEGEKRRLALTYSAAMVDMEAATVARLAEMRSVPFGCIKAISDEMDADLPGFNPYIDDRGQLRMLPFILHSLKHPRYWKPMMQLGRTSGRAADTLASAILTFLTGPKNIVEINRTGNVDW